MEQAARFGDRSKLRIQTPVEWPSNDVWARAKINPPDFIRVLFEENTPDEKLGDILTNPILDHGNLLRAFNCAEKVKDIVEEEQPVMSLGARLRKSRGEKEKPDFIPLPAKQRQLRLQTALSFIKDGMEKHTMYPGLKDALIRCGNLVLFQCMGPEWIDKYKKESQD